MRPPVRIMGTAPVQKLHTTKWSIVKRNCQLTRATVSWIDKTVVGAQGAVSGESVVNTDSWLSHLGLEPFLEHKGGEGVIPPRGVRLWLRQKTITTL